MQRRIEVTEQELLERLTLELQEESGIDCAFYGLHRLQGIDEVGCNWSTAWLKSAPLDAGTRLLAERVVFDAKQRYNVAPAR